MATKTYKATEVIKEEDVTRDDGGAGLSFRIDGPDFPTEHGSRGLWFQVCSYHSGDGDYGDWEYEHPEFKKMIGKKITITVKVEDP